MPLAPITAPDTGQRSAIHALLFSVLRLAAGDRLVVVLDPARAPQASWLAARARTAGVTTRLVGAAGWHVPRLGPRIRAAFDAVGPPEGGDRGGTVLFLGGEPLDPAAVALPAGVTGLQLPTGVPLEGVEDPGPRAVLLEWLRARTQSADTFSVTSGEGAGERLRVTRAAGPAVRVEAQEPAPGRLRIAPLGRVAVRAATAEGVFVADAAVRINRTTRLGAALAHRPVRLEIRDGRVTGVECPDPLLKGFLRRAVDVHRAGRVTTARCSPVGEQALVGLRLTADAADIHSTASADLRIDLTAHASWDTVPGRDQ